MTIVRKQPMVIVKNYNFSSGSSGYGGSIWCRPRYSCCQPVSTSCCSGGVGFWGGFGQGIGLGISNLFSGLFGGGMFGGGMFGGGLFYNNGIFGGGYNPWARTNNNTQNTNNNNSNSNTTNSSSLDKDNPKISELSKEIGKLNDKDKLSQTDYDKQLKKIKDLAKDLDGVQDDCNKQWLGDLLRQLNGHAGDGVNIANSLDDLLADKTEPKKKIKDNPEATNDVGGSNGNGDGNGNVGATDIDHGFGKTDSDWNNSHVNFNQSQIPSDNDTNVTENENFKNGITEKHIEKATDPSDKIRDIQGTNAVSKTKHKEDGNDTIFPEYISITDRDNKKEYHFKCAKTVGKTAVYITPKTDTNNNVYYLKVVGNKLVLCQEYGTSKKESVYGANERNEE